MYFASFLKWRRTQMHQRQAEKALTVVKSFLKKYSVSIKQKFFLFDKMITPNTFYGAEIWGFKEMKEIEMVQHKFCKYVLNVGSQTPNCAVMGDCGILPLYVQCTTKCIKYWLKIIHMNDNRYPRIVYTLLFNLDSNGRRTWASDIVLYRYGFGVVWISQELGDLDSFLFEFKQRLKDCATQDWQSDISSTNELYTYCTYIKSILVSEKYLVCISNINHKIALAKFRCSSHNLGIETGRRDQIERCERLCIFLNN